MGQIKSSQLRSGQVWISQVRPDQDKPQLSNKVSVLLGKILEGLDKSGQVTNQKKNSTKEDLTKYQKSGQVRSGHVWISQVKSGQITTSHVKGRIRRLIVQKRT